jgi:ATP-dependent Zn protease
MIDIEIKKFISEAHVRVREILSSHRAALEDLAKLLLEKEVVERPEMQAILKARNGDSAKKEEAGECHAHS